MPDVLYYVLYLLYLCVYCLVACPHTEESQRLKKKNGEPTPQGKNWRLWQRRCRWTCCCSTLYFTCFISVWVYEALSYDGMSVCGLGLAAALLYTLLALLCWHAAALLCSLLYYAVLLALLCTLLSLLCLDLHYALLYTLLALLCCFTLYFICCCFTLDLLLVYFILYLLYFMLYLAEIVRHKKKKMEIMATKLPLDFELIVTSPLTRALQTG
jgi:hypothetical protein